MARGPRDPSARTKSRQSCRLLGRRRSMAGDRCGPRAFRLLASRQVLSSWTSPRSRRPARIDTPASLGKIQTHGAAHECSARPEERPTDRPLLMSTSANGADRRLDTLTAARGSAPSSHQSLYFGHIGTNSENKKRGMISVSCNQDILRCKMRWNKASPHLIFFSSGPVYDLQGCCHLGEQRMLRAPLSSGALPRRAR